MKINLIEMEGLLRGQCIPGDLLVNETLAEYLVRQFAKLNEQLSESRREFTAANATIHNLELKVAQVVAENANKSRCLGFFASVIKCGEEWTSVCQHEYSKALETPATDAYLAEVRAQGVEMAIEHIEQTICPNHETILHEFAAQLRQGAENE